MDDNLGKMIDELSQVTLSLQSDMLKVMTGINKINLLITKINQYRGNNNNMMNNMNMNMMAMGNIMGDINNNMMNMNYMNNMMNMNNMNNMNRMDNMNNIMSVNNMNNMMNNMMNVNDDMSVNNETELSNPIFKIVQVEPEINVYFRKHTASNEVNVKSIKCKESDLLSNVIEKYRQEANDYDEDITFIFNAKRINPNLHVGEAGLYNNSNIFVIKPKNVV